MNATASVIAKATDGRLIRRLGGGALCGTASERDGLGSVIGDDAKYSTLGVRHHQATPLTQPPRVTDPFHVLVMLDVDDLGMLRCAVRSRLMASCARRTRRRSDCGPCWTRRARGSRLAVGASDSQRGHGKSSAFVAFLERRSDAGPVVAPAVACPELGA